MTRLLRLGVRGQAKPARCPEPLCPHQVFPRTAWRLAPRQRAFPLLQSSYELLRQTTSLPLTSVVPHTAGLCRLSSVPAARWPFPAFSPRIFLRMRGPRPRRLPWCTYPFLPRRPRPSPPRDRLGTRATFRTATSVRGRLSRLAVIHSCSGLRMCSPLRSLLPQCCHWAAVACTSEPMTVCYLPAHRICSPSESGN
jgi:hypothetical protein